MQWKKVWSQERKCFGEVDKYMLVPMLHLEGRQIRITVEEAVDECCEKWRGAYVGGYVCSESSVKTWSRVCRFCPECGSRL